jgi:mono/diheme cytochrome c family protein
MTPYTPLPMMTTPPRTTTPPTPRPWPAPARIAAASALIIGWILVAALAWPGPAGRAGGPDSHPPLAPVALPPAEPPLAVGPITFFNASCGNCHGDYGMFLAVELDHDLVDGESALRGLIAEMVTNQAQTHLPPREIDALTAYCRSLLGPSPFLAWTGADNGELRGEVTPGAIVEVLTRSGNTPAVVMGHTWTARLPAGAGPATVRATLADASTELRIPAAPFSHAAGARSSSPDSPATSSPAN